MASVRVRAGRVLSSSDDPRRLQLSRGSLMGLAKVGKRLLLRLERRMAISSVLYGLGSGLCTSRELASFSEMGLRRTQRALSEAIRLGLVSRRLWRSVRTGGREATYWLDTDGLERAGWSRDS